MDALFIGCALKQPILAERQSKTQGVINVVGATAVREPTGPGIPIQTPYSVLIRIRGTSDLLFHRWSNESIANKASAAKGSAAKKTDDIESFVYRDSEENLAIPGEYVRQA
ncbi:MAG: hypothetical protein ACYCVB_07380, partial [Bacilli bacterium]